MKLKYIGRQRKGKFVYKNYEQLVTKGEMYDVPQEYVNKFIESGLWEKVKPKPTRTSVKKEQTQQKESIEE